MMTIIKNKDKVPGALKCLVCLLYLAFTVSCDDFVDVGAPKNELVGKAVFTDAQTAEAALTGIYSQMTEGFGGFANYRTTLLAGLCSDELDNYSTSAERIEFYENGLTSGNNELLGLWNEPFSYIYQANAVMEGLQNADGIEGAIKERLMGEALFIRAFCHFYLVNFFGDIPYIITTDYLENAMAKRVSVMDVYGFLTEDLLKSMPLLSESYASDGRVRPNKHAAQALLARAYLYMGDWEHAEQYATSVIEATGHYGLESDLGNVFLKGSNEAIWQLYPVITGLNTVEGFSFILSGSPYSMALNERVYGAFEDHDLRKGAWIGTSNVGADSYYYPYKYQVYFANELTEYYMVLRLAEQYLVRAEARAQQGNLSGALDDLDAIRNRAGLGDFLGTSQETVLEAIYKERQRELFAEWGHRWFDLKRTGRANAVLSGIKPGWQATDTWFPIPQSELQNNPNMVQNPGY